jgi:hypothetical protein
MAVMAAWVTTRRLTPALLAIGVAALAALPWLSPARRSVRHTFVPGAVASDTGEEAHAASGFFGRDPRDLLLYDQQGPSPSEVRTREILNRLDASRSR